MKLWILLILSMNLMENFVRITYSFWPLPYIGVPLAVYHIYIYSLYLLYYILYYVQLYLYFWYFACTRTNNDRLRVSTPCKYKYVYTYIYIYKCIICVIIRLGARVEDFPTNNHQSLVVPFYSFYIAYIIIETRSPFLILP